MIFSYYVFSCFIYSLYISHIAFSGTVTITCSVLCVHAFPLTMFVACAFVTFHNKYLVP